MPNTQIIVSAKDMASGTFRKMKISAGGLATQLIALKASFEGVVGMRDLAVGFIRTASEFETMAISLETVTGSAEQAEAATGWISEFTSKTPYQLNEVTNSFRRLAAYGLDPTKYMKPLGDVAAAFGEPMQKAVEMFADAAQGEFERLKEFGVRASQQGDQVTFKWSQNGQQMVKHTRKTQQGITSALGEIFLRYDGAMEKQMDGWIGMMSNLSDIWTNFKKMVMESGPFKVMKESLKEFLNTLQKEEGRMNLAKWAATTARVVVGGFKEMVNAAQGLMKALRIIHGSLLGLKVAYAETLLLATKMSPASWLANKDSIAGKANRQQQVKYAEMARSAKVQILILKQKMKDTASVFDPILAAIDKLDVASNIKTMVGNTSGKFSFSGGGGTDGDSSESGPTKAQAKANENRLKLEADFVKKIAKLNMDKFEFAKFELNLEVEAAKGKIDKVLEAEKLGEDERLKLKNNMLAQLAEYQKGSLAEISKNQKEETAKLAKDLADQNKKTLEEMKTTAREVLASSDSVFAGMQLGLAEYNDTMAETGRSVADVTRRTLEGSTDQILDYMHNKKVEVSSVIQSISQEFERMVMNKMFMQPASNWMSGVISGASSMFSGFSLPGFADGGISYGPQIAAVSEGRYSAEAHVPLPDGRSIPVTMQGRGDGATNVIVDTKVEVINQTGQAVSARSEPTADGIRLILQSVSESIVHDGPVSKAIQAGFKVSKRVR